MTTSLTISFISTLALLLPTVTDSPIVTLKTELLSGAVIAQNTSREYSSFEDYQKDCIEDSRQRGLGTQDAGRLCNCTISTFEDRFSLEEFKKLIEEAKTNAAAENTLVEVGETCFEKILYEN